MNLKDKLKKKRVPVDQINKFLGYIQGEKDKERGKSYTPVTNNSDDMLYTMFIKFWNLGLTIDGVNVVITGKAMAMVTFHGYQNKVMKSYPDAKFDTQLVRGEDTFKVSKKDGEVSYEHEIANPFGNDEIKGAYCVITIDGKNYFEALNQSDYNAMRGGSKNNSTWDKWQSEFWLKSVIKRACKRHFFKEVQEIDEVDNADYGQADDRKVAVSDEEYDKISDTISLIQEAPDLDALKAIFTQSGFTKNKAVIAAKDERKAQLNADN